MRFAIVLIGTVVASGALGGGWAYMGAPDPVETVGGIASGAQDLWRGTMQKFDGRYYTRGADYAACAADYGGRATHKTNGEIMFSCECFDKSMGLLGGADREAALRGLGTPVRTASLGAPSGMTAAAGRLLKKCGITPPKGPALDIRGTM